MQQFFLSRMWRFLLLGMMGALAGCTSATSSMPYLTPPATTAYTLDAGDELSINITGLEQYTNAKFVVGDDGVLSLPLVDDIRVSGKTPSEVEANIREQLLQREILVNPFVDVQTAQMRPFYILGEVNKPGEYEYRPGLSAIGAISLAGGYTYRADKHELVVSRLVDGDRVTGRINPTDPIRPSDQITVLERWF